MTWDLLRKPAGASAIVIICSSLRASVGNWPDIDSRL